MKKSILTEIIWLAGLFILSFLAGSWLFSNYALDVSAQNTYYTNGSSFSLKWPIIWAFFISIVFVVYLVRAIFFRFKSLKINIISIVVTCILLYCVESINASEAYYFSSAYFTNPLGSTTVKGLFYGADPSVLFWLQAFPWLKMFLVISIAFTNYMTGRLPKSS